jgi:hypothetical protein
VQTRVTRAKTAALGSADTALLKKSLGRTKSSASVVVAQARKRAALGDVSNVAKHDTAGSKDGKRKALTSKAGLVSKAAQPTKVEKLSRSQSTKSILQPRTKAAAAPADLKRPASGSGGSGHVTKKRQTGSSSSKVVVQDDSLDENAEPQNADVLVETKSSTTLVEVEVEVMDDARSETTEAPAVHKMAPPPEVPDLDTEDLDDPLMVAEYVGEIFEYLLELEPQTMANPDYMNSQPDLEWQMRGILVDWLLEVHTRFRLLPETLFLAVNIIDRFLSTKVVQLDRLQLVGVTAMFIASKYEEVLSPHVSNFRHVADDGFTDDEILSAERYVLTALNYDLSYPNPMNFVRRISKADNYDVQTRTLGKYLLEISCLDHQFIGHPPHRIAAAAMYLSRLILGRGPWDATIAHYAGCTEEQLLPCFQLMLQYLTGPVKHDAFFKKYAHKKFMKGMHSGFQVFKTLFSLANLNAASMVVRQWVKHNGAAFMEVSDDEEASVNTSTKSCR